MDGGFGVNCNGRIICGAGRDDSDKKLNNVFEFRNNNFTEIKPLKTKRYYCSSLYIPNTLQNHDGFLLVAGSYRGEGKNTMEYLMINDNVENNDWILCEDNLPCTFHRHQMNLLQNKLILTRGYINGIYSNNVLSLIHI